MYIRDVCTRCIYKMYVQDVCTRCIYEMYIQDLYTRCTKNMRKYETDGRYPSQYSFHNGARSWQLAGDLSP